MLLCRWLWLVRLTHYRAAGFFIFTKEEATPRSRFFTLKFYM
jgi:hypothetical protein